MLLQGKGSTLGTFKLLGSKFTLPRSDTLEGYNPLVVMQAHLVTSICFLSGTNEVGGLSGTPDVAAA